MGLGDGRGVGRICLAVNPTGLVDKDVYNYLTTLKKTYKAKLETELRENQMHNITFIIAKVMDELFDELGKL